MLAARCKIVLAVCAVFAVHLASLELTDSLLPEHAVDPMASWVRSTPSKQAASRENGFGADNHTKLPTASQLPPPSAFPPPQKVNGDGVGAPSAVPPAAAASSTAEAPAASIETAVAVSSTAAPQPPPAAAPPLLKQAPKPPQKSYLPTFIAPEAYGKKMGEHARIKREVQEQVAKTFAAKEKAKLQKKKKKVVSAPIAPPEDDDDGLGWKTFFIIFLGARRAHSTGSATPTRLPTWPPSLHALRLAARPSAKAIAVPHHRPLAMHALSRPHAQNTRTRCRACTHAGIFTALAEALDLDVLLGIVFMPFVKAMQWLAAKYQNVNLDPSVWMKHITDFYNELCRSSPGVSAPAINPGLRFEGAWQPAAWAGEVRRARVPSFLPPCFP